MRPGPARTLRRSSAAFTSDFPGISVELTQIRSASAGTQWARLAIDSGLADLISIENPKFLFLIRCCAPVFSARSMTFLRSTVGPR